MKVITFGTFDVFHVGHVNILERAKLHGSQLIVGVSSDALNMEKNLDSLYIRKMIDNILFAHFNV